MNLNTQFQSVITTQKVGFKKIVKKIINSAGFNLQHLTLGSNPSLQLLKVLSRFKNDIVLDVGANKGQFASELRSSGFHGDIISFEPLSTAHSVLTKAASRDEKWQIHPRGAIGDYDGEIEINVASNTVSSSVLPMTDLHTSVSEESAYVSSEKVPIFKLDSVVHKYFTNPHHRLFLKIDVQGFEWEVLDGASQTLPYVQGLLCELSLVPLYEGQRLWMEMIRRLENDGFTLWSIRNCFINPCDGQTLQVDAIFVRL